jgi:hypothetical protein
MKISIAILFTLTAFITSCSGGAEKPDQHRNHSVSESQLDSLDHHADEVSEDADQMIQEVDSLLEGI